MSGIKKIVCFSQTYPDGQTDHVFYTLFRELFAGDITKDITVRNKTLHTRNVVIRFYTWNIESEVILGMCHTDLFVLSYPPKEIQESEKYIRDIGIIQHKAMVFDAPILELKERFT